MVVVVVVLFTPKQPGWLDWAVSCCLVRESIPPVCHSAPLISIPGRELTRAVGKATRPHRGRN